MNPKHLLPWYGGKSAKQRFKELEEKAGTLPVMFALFFTEAIKITTLSIPFLHGMDMLPQGIIDAFQMFVAAIIVGIIYVYDFESIDNIAE
jgi:uncharacterized membrane protein (DUF485 family)